MSPTIETTIDPSWVLQGSASDLPRRWSFARFWNEERFFLLATGLSFVLVGTVFQHAAIARWVGFAFAAYAAVANDSIQTIGAFIASNRDKPWWVLWLFMGGILVVTMTYGWAMHHGDVSYERLAAKGFEHAPEHFDYLQLAAPVFLLILTRMRMPVSTTFLLLTSFSTSAVSVGQMLGKSLLGYVVAFATAFVVWIVLSRIIDRTCKARRPHRAWRVAQWIISGGLWMVWLMQDAANTAVYLPRSLSLGELLVVAGVMVVGLGYLFRTGGERVQRVVDEKSNVVDVRAATLIDLVYAVTLFYFQAHSKIPMSTTWVFLGLLGGREVAMTLRRAAGGQSLRGSLRVVGRDILFAGLGLGLSLVIAIAVNEPLRRAILGG